MPRSPCYCQQCEDETPERQCGKCAAWLCCRCWEEHDCENEDPRAEDYQAGGKYSHGYTIS